MLTTAPGTRAAAFGPAEWGLLVAIALMWGSSYLWIAIGLEHFSPPVIALARLLLGAACLACFPGTRARVERVDWPRIALLGLTWMAVPLLLYPVAQQWVDSSTAGAINGTMPLFSAALAALLLRRLPGPAQLGGLAVGFTGVLLVTLSEATGAGGSPLGIGLLLFSTVLYAVAFNLAVPLTQRYGSLPVLLRAQLVAIAFVLPFGIWGLPRSEWDWGRPGPWWCSARWAAASPSWPPPSSEPAPARCAVRFPSTSCRWWPCCSAPWCATRSSPAPPSPGWRW